MVLNLINSVVDGSTDQAKFEESCRLLLGTRAYMVLTIDRVITQAVKQLALLALDPTFQKFEAVAFLHRSRGAGLDAAAAHRCRAPTSPWGARHTAR